MPEERTTRPGVGLTPVAFEILLSLAKGPQHGYGIKLDIQERTGGDMALGSGTLYQAIQRLERGGLIAEARPPHPQPDARRGRYYQLEPDGRTALERELARLHRAIEYARSQKLVSDLKVSG